jgi:predicted Rossmann fold nucleotide-binding protein DprA/Smf involved in DNA uptake
MNGALEAGGTALGVLADSLEKKAMSRENRDHLRSGRLVLVSPYDPNAGFNVGHAMRRNKIVYAFADAALVVNAEIGRGGTWAGALEQLERHSSVPVYVRTTGPVSEALEALRGRGALPWPENLDGNAAVELALTPDRAPTPAGGRQATLLPPGETPQKVSDRPRAFKGRAAEELYRTVRRLIRDVLSEPKKPAEVAEALQVTPRQADQWLKRLLEEGIVVRTSRPVRYSLSPPSLFSMEVEDPLSEPAKAARGS